MRLVTSMPWRPFRFNTFFRAAGLFVTHLTGSEVIQSRLYMCEWKKGI